MTFLIASHLLQVLAALCAILLACRQPAHRPVAWLLAGTMAANTVRVVLQRTVLVPAIVALGGDPAHGIPPPVPLTGWMRVAAHVDHALFMGWSAAFAICSLWVLRRPWPEWRYDSAVPLQYEYYQEPPSKVLDRAWRLVGPTVVWVAMVAYFVLTYPDSRPLHRAGYLLAELLALATGVAAVAGWLRRRAPGDPVGVTRRCLLYVLALDGLALFGPHMTHGFFDGWDKAQAVYCVMYIALIAAQGSALWQSKRG